MVGSVQPIISSIITSLGVSQQLQSPPWLIHEPSGQGRKLGDDAKPAPTNSVKFGSVQP